jgi:hypothetical protein
MTAISPRITGELHANMDGDFSGTQDCFINPESRATDGARSWAPEIAETKKATRWGRLSNWCRSDQSLQ